VGNHSLQISHVAAKFSMRLELVARLKLAASPNKNDQVPLAAILARHNGELSAKGLWNYSGLEIGSFYQQLKTEMARGWIVEPEKARVIEKATEPNRREIA
jgi:type I restriction enzyme, S subunit